LEDKCNWVKNLDFKKIAAAKKPHNIAEQLILGSTAKLSSMLRNSILQMLKYVYMLQDS